MRGFVGDVTLAARRLLATPLFTIFAMLSLAGRCRRHHRGLLRCRCDLPEGTRHQ